MNLSKNNKKTIRVLQLGNAGSLYGAERWILALVKYLDPNKIETWVASIRDDSTLEAPLCSEAEKLGLKSCVFDFYGKFNLSSVRHLKKFILDNKIDIIHTHHYKTDLIGILATRGTSCLNVSTPHGWTKKPDLKLFIYEVANRIIFPFFDAVVPLSRGIFKPLSLIPRLKKKLYLIENGVDTQEIEDNSMISPELVKLKAEGTVIIGYIGRLTPGKGLDVLFKAFSEYFEPSWHIVIIGEGEQEEELREMANDLNINNKITFYGFKPDRISFLNGFDVFVLPSRSEGTPRCLMEAMVAGIPIVASDIPGCRNLIDGETTGLLFQPDNPKQLADKIKELNSNSELKSKFSCMGKKYIKNNFSAAKMSQQYERLFLNLCKLSEKI